MSRESTEELRRRLLSDPQVQREISMRAYEIYITRGGGPGREVDDWFQAEHEILSVLIERDSRRAEGATSGGAGMGRIEDGAGAATTDRKNEPPAQTAEERAESQSALGVWSAAEPSSTERAPEIGAAEEFQVGATTPKKARTRAASKPASASSRKAKSKEPSSKESSSKEASGKGVAAKKTAARAASKKSDEKAKTSKTRSQTGES